MKAMKCMLVLLPLLVSGCGTLRTIWPGGEEQVPVTPPTQQAEAPTFPQTAADRDETTPAAPETSGENEPAPIGELGTPVEPTPAEDLAGVDDSASPSEADGSPAPAADGSGPVDADEGVVAQAPAQEPTSVEALPELPDSLQLPEDLDSPEPNAMTDDTEPAEPTQTGGTSGSLAELPELEGPFAPAGGEETTQPASETDAAPTGSQLVSTAVVRVGDEFLTVGDVLEGVGPALAQLPDGLSERQFRTRASQVIREYLQQRMYQMLVADEARRRLSDPQKQFIDRQVENHRKDLIARAGGSEEKLRRSLQELGTDLEHELSSYRRSVIVQSYLHRKFQSAISVNRRMLWNEYRRNRQRYAQPRRVQMQLIQIPADHFLPEDVTDPNEQQLAAAREQARQQAERALQAIRNGTDFADVARKYSHGPMASEGGTWPLMAKDNFAKKTIEAVAFQLEEGEVSGVVDYDEGWAIVRAREVEPAHVRPFEAVQQELEETIRQRREAKLRGEYFEELQDQTSMWESEEGFLAAVDQAVRRFRGR